MRHILLVSLIAFSSIVHASRTLATFAIQYADPAQIEAVVQTYLSPGSSVSLYRNQLVVNATEEELARTAALIRQLDVAGRQLRISVKTGSESRETQQVLRASGEISGGSGSRTQTRTTVTVTDRSHSSGGSGTQGVRATEGQAAYISVGSSAPINSYRSTVGGRLLMQQDYVSADTGFYATAWVTDDTVRVSIDQQRQQFEGQNIQSQQLQSEISGPLGAWIPIGTMADNRQHSGSGILQRESGRKDSSDTVYLKVELLD